MNFGILIRLQREYERGIKALFASISQNVQGLSAVDTIKYLSMIGRRPEVKQLCSNLAQRMVKAQYRKNPQTLVKQRFAGLVRSARLERAAFRVGV